MNMSKVSLAELGPGGGFARDPRFGQPGLAPPAPPPEPEDPIGRAWAEGFAAGETAAREAAEALAAEAEAARARIEIALARLDAEQQEALRLRLIETVTVLCEAALAPLALDPDALAARVAKAAAMLARSDDYRVLRLHPDDLALVAARLPEGLACEPDSALERGALRIETQGGGVEDGPASWRRALAEALGAC